MTNTAPLPLVSVIMPAYNSQKYIRRALESVFAQTYTHYEFIVIDDGSSDATRDILLEYGDKLQYLHQSNSGASSARNYGIESSIGSLIAFLDSDDLWYPQKLKIQVDAYLKEPSASIIHTEVDKQFDFKGYIEVREEDTLAVHKSFIEVFKATNLKTPSVMIPRKV
ncbi:Putative N-acetylgalactosaminyl-diphosphoundecaprenol glucuronosyltransferase, partial [hydrothermal vent metagenome]